MQQIVPILVFGALWSTLIAPLSQHWAVDPQYSFGWFVLFSKKLDLEGIFMIRISPNGKHAFLGIEKIVEAK